MWADEKGARKMPRLVQRLLGQRNEPEDARRDLSAPRHVTVVPAEVFQRMASTDEPDDAPGLRQIVAHSRRHPALR